MKMFFLVLLLTFSTFGSFSSSAADSDSFVCRKMRKIKLKELKAALLETCDVDKPFSIAEADDSFATTYTICCHKKK